MRKLTLLICALLLVTACSNQNTITTPFVATVIATSSLIDSVKPKHTLLELADYRKLEIENTSSFISGDTILITPNPDLSITVEHKQPHSDTTKFRVYSIF